MEKDLHDRLDRARAIAQENIERATTGLMESAENLTARAKAATADMNKTMESAKAQAGKAAGQANRIITEHPLAAVAAGVAIGALAAYLLPKKMRAKPQEPSETPPAE
ncbi:MAG: hypothetical protein R3E04_09875 [Sphingobium sp.]